MRNTTKYVIFSTMKIAGFYRLGRWRARDKAVVLTYHGVLPQIPNGEDFYEYRNFVSTRQFEEHLQLLLKYYRPLKLEDFFDPQKDLSGGFLITFDDGFRNNYRYAMPLLKKYGLQGCFFIATNLIGTRDYLWTEQVTLLLKKSRRTRVEIGGHNPRVYTLKTSADRDRASEQLRKYLKRLSRPELFEALAQLKKQLNDVPLLVGPEQEERYLFMTWEEVREMLRAGQYIGAHTHSHPILATLSEEESFEELRFSKELIEEHTGQPCLTMSYPNGESADFSETQKKQLAELGYRCAFTQMPHFNNHANDPYELRRINVSRNISLPLLEAMLCGYRS